MYIPCWTFQLQWHRNGSRTSTTISTTFSRDLSHVTTAIYTVYLLTNFHKLKNFSNGNAFQRRLIWTPMGKLLTLWTYNSFIKFLILHNLWALECNMTRTHAVYDCGKVWERDYWAEIDKQIVRHQLHSFEYLKPLKYVTPVLKVTCVSLKLNSKTQNEGFFLYCHLKLLQLPPFLISYHI